MSCSSLRLSCSHVFVDKKDNMMNVSSSKFDIEDIDRLSIGAGVLPYSIDADKNIYVLLGRERFMPSWKGSCKWSGFEGSRKPNETIACTAIREFVEESLSVPLEKAVIETIIHEKKYLMRIVLKIINHDSNDRYHCTYVVRIPWDNTIPTKFHRTRKKIEYIDGLTQEWKHALPSLFHDVEHVGPIVRSTSFNGGEQVHVRCARPSTTCILNAPWELIVDDDKSQEMQIVVDGDVAKQIWKWHLLREKLESALVDRHESVSAQWDVEYNKVESVNISMDHMEKDQIRWWKLTDLQLVMEQRGTLGQDRFRPYFLPVLQTFLNKCTEDAALTAFVSAPLNEFSEQLPSTTANLSEATALPVLELQ